MRSCRQRAEHAEPRLPLSDGGYPLSTIDRAIRAVRVVVLLARPCGSWIGSGVEGTPVGSMQNVTPS